MTNGVDPDERRSVASDPGLFVRICRRIRQIELPSEIILGPPWFGRDPSPTWNGLVIIGNRQDEGSVLCWFALDPCSRWRLCRDPGRKRSLSLCSSKRSPDLYFTVHWKKLLGHSELIVSGMLIGAKRTGLVILYKAASDWLTMKMN